MMTKRNKKQLMRQILKGMYPTLASEVYPSVPEAFWRTVEIAMYLDSPLIPDIKRAAILDLGCGNGWFFNQLRKHWRLRKAEVGVDINKGVLKKAKAAKAYRNLIVADARALPLKTGKINIVLSNCTLEHIPNLSEALQEISRVTAHGGHTVFSVPSEFFNKLLLLPSQRYVEMRNRILSHINMFDFDCWKESLREKGFSLAYSELYLSQNMKLWDFLSTLNYILRKKIPGQIVNLLILKLFRNILEKALSKELEKSGKIGGGGRLFIAKKLSTSKNVGTRFH